MNQIDLTTSYENYYCDNYFSGEGILTVPIMECADTLDNFYNPNFCLS